MAPKKGTKRGAAPHADEPDTKKVHAVLKGHHVTIGVYKTIVEALENPLLELNDDCRKMLISVLPYSLCVPVDERHDQQTMAVAMIEESLTAIQAKLAAALEAEDAKVAGAEGKKAEFAAALKVADEALAAAKSATAAADAAAKELNEAVNEAIKVKNFQLALQKKGDASLVATKKDKESLEGALNGPFNKLKLGEFEAGHAAGLYKSVSSQFSKLGMEDSMKTALPSSIQKKPEERGTFDNLVLKQLEDTFTKKISELQEILDAGAPAQEERQKAVDDAQAAVAAAEGQSAEAAFKLDTLKAEQQTAEANLQAAVSAVEAYESEYAEATKARDTLKADLEQFQTVSLANFQELKEKISVKKRREIQAEEKAAAAAVAAAEAAAEAATAAAAAAKAAEEASAEAAAAVVPPAEGEPMEVEAPAGEGQ